MLSYGPTTITIGDLGGTKIIYEGSFAFVTLPSTGQVTLMGSFRTTCSATAATTDCPRAEAATRSTGARGRRPQRPTTP